MKPRLILYISGLLIYAVFRSFEPAPAFDKIEILSDDLFLLNNDEYQVVNIDHVIRDFRKTINPDIKYDHVIEFKVHAEVPMGVVHDMKVALRKNQLRTLFYPSNPWWQFWGQ